MDVSGSILRTWMPAIRAGMTKSGFSSFPCERKLINHFVVSPTVGSVKEKLGNDVHTKRVAAVPAVL